MDRELIVIAHNIRSTHNVGALLRTCDGLDIKKIYLTGYTPYPKSRQDNRLPHLSSKTHKQISKTALGAETTVDWEHIEISTDEKLYDLISKLKESGYKVAGLEQTPTSVSLPDFTAPSKLVLIVGNEITGIEKNIIDRLDFCLEIPMLGKKESFNVVIAASMALYHCRYINI